MINVTQNLGSAIGTYGAPVVILVIVLALVDLALRGWGMWRAARMQEKWWFLAMFVVSSAGILPAIYLLSTRNKYAGNK